MTEPKDDIETTNDADLLEQIEIKSDDDLSERVTLARERINDLTVSEYSELHEEKKAYFRSIAKFLVLVWNTYDEVCAGRTEEPFEALLAKNHALYEDILPKHYEQSYANPVYATKQLGEQEGGFFSFLYTELRSMIPYAHEGRLWDLLVRTELFLEVYGAVTQDASYEELCELLRNFVRDYAQIFAQQRIAALLGVGNTYNTGLAKGETAFVEQILSTAAETNDRFLFAYGEYISEEQIRLVRFCAELPEETIVLIAHTFAEGFRKGFEVGRKDLSIKKTVEIRYTIGFERIISAAVIEFAKLGLRPIFRRSPASTFLDKSPQTIGYTTISPNRQMDFDHKGDKTLFWDKKTISRKLETTRNAFQEMAQYAKEFAGPAIMETFGEPQFAPMNHPQALTLTKEQNALYLTYRAKAAALQREFIPEEERSYTIIAFPLPGNIEPFEEIFQTIIAINTLDYHLYEESQQHLIDALDQAIACEIKGCNGNQTTLTISLKPLEDPTTQSLFENCVADVNIPVGEVFTSPALNGTNGTLHIKSVYIDELEYRDLTITFTDGWVSHYTCANFETDIENKTLIRENLFGFHDTLPMGEFAIGTNMPAYQAAQKYGIEDKLPVLIAEKMGPHFAVGDTCYAHTEDIRVYNQDGKELIAKDNEVSALRTTKQKDKAYFNCHTDITLPYDEVGEVTAILPNGDRIAILREGKFVLAGCERLNTG